MPMNARANVAAEVVEKACGEKTVGESRFRRCLILEIDLSIKVVLAVL